MFIMDCETANNKISVRELINKLEQIEDKSLPVSLGVGYERTDYFWIEVYKDEVIVGIS